MNRRVATVIAVTVAIIAISTAVTAYRLVDWHRRGYAGISAYSEPTKQTRRTPSKNAMFQNGRILMTMPQSAGAKAGLQRGDVILSIGGVPLDDRAGIARLDAKVKTGDVVTYHVRRGTSERDIRVKFCSPITDAMTETSLLVSAIVALSFVVIGLLVFTRKPDDMRAIVFHAMSVVGAVSVITVNAFAYDASGARGIVFGPSNLLAWGIVVLFGLSAFPLTLHLALIFPKDRALVRKHPYVIRWIYGLGAFAAIALIAMLGGMQFFNETMERGSAYALGRTIATGAAIIAIAGMLVALRVAYVGRREGVRTAFLRRPLQTIFALFAAIEASILILRFTRLSIVGGIILLFGVLFVIALVVAYPVFTCISLYRSYREANAEEKRQVRWPLWGTLIAIALKIVITIASLALGMMLAVGPGTSQGLFRATEVISFIPRLASLLIPISFAFAILKYRLMNIDVIIKKTVAYTILSGAIIFMYLVLVGGLGTMLVTVAGVRNQTMVIASTLVVALVFVPLRNRLQTLVDRNLFRQKYDYPQALRAISAETLAATDLISFLGTAAETIQQALQNRSVVIFMRRHDELVASAKVGVPDAILGSLRIDSLSAEGVDRPLDPRRRPLAAGAAEPLKKVGTALVVPIRSHGGLHGLLALASKLSDREFDLEDLEFASSAADQLAIATDRIRLQHEETDFDEAREMQQSLLPGEVPQVAGLDISGTWKPARAVGGDYYDLLKLSETKVGICIGDVAGKGMPAALLMSALQAAVRASAADSVDPKDLCERVRRVVVPSLSGGRFVTFFYCTIETASRRVLYCNAGHNPPVLVRADGEIHRLDVGGSVFSRLFRNEHFNQGEIELKDGDRIVLFTDGVSESRDATGNDYGEDRLEQLIAAGRSLSARELIATILDEVTSFSAGRTDDDLTLVAVGITQRA